MYIYSVCVNRHYPRLEQLELLFLTVSVNFQMVSVLQSVEVQHFLSSSQLRYSIKFELECLNSNIPLLVLLGLDFKIYFLNLLFGRAHMLRTLFTIQAGEGSHLNVA